MTARTTLKLKLTLLGIPLTCGALQAGAGERVPPQVVDTLESIYGQQDAPATSQPARDAGQALNVSVPSVYIPITPCRIADTRQISLPFGGGLAPSAGSAETVGFWGWAGTEGYGSFGGSQVGCGIPSTAAAIHVNFTIVSPKGNGFLRTWPNNSSAPNATVFAWAKSFGASNAVTVPICSDATESSGSDNCLDPLNPEGTTDFFVRITSQFKEDLVIDALGYYEPLSLQ